MIFDLIIATPRNNEVQRMNSDNLVQHPISYIPGLKLKKTGFYLVSKFLFHCTKIEVFH